MKYVFATALAFFLLLMPVAGAEREVHKFLDAVMCDERDALVEVLALRNWEGEIAVDAWARKPEGCRHVDIAYIEIIENDGYAHVNNRLYAIWRVHLLSVMLTVSKNNPEILQGELYVGIPNPDALGI